MLCILIEVIHLLCPYMYIFIGADAQKRPAQNDPRTSTFQDWKRQSRGSLAASFTMKLRLGGAKRLGPYETGLENFGIWAELRFPPILNPSLSSWRLWPRGAVSIDASSLCPLVACASLKACVASGAKLLALGPIGVSAHAGMVALRRSTWVWQACSQSRE